MPAPSRTQKGRFNKIFLDSTGTGTPTWVEMNLVRDGSWTITPQLESVTVRKHGRANRQESFAYDLEITYELRVPVVKTGVPYYVQLRDASMSGAPLQVKLCDGSPTGTGVEQLVLWTEVSAFEVSAPIDGHVVVSVSMVTTSSDDEPEFTTVSGS